MNNMHPPRPVVSSSRQERIPANVIEATRKLRRTMKYYDAAKLMGVNTQTFDKLYHGDLFLRRDALERVTAKLQELGVLEGA